MERENGVTLVDGSSVIEEKNREESTGDSNKEGGSVTNGEVPTVNAISEPAKTAESFNSSGVVVKASATVATSKNSKSTKEPRTLLGGSPKNNKLAKDKANLKATTLISRNQRILTQSLSFPAKGVSADVMSKSIDVYPMKREVKHAQKEGIKPHASGGSVPSTSRFNHPNRPTSNGPHSKEANTIGGASGLRTSLGSTSGTRCSVPGKSGYFNATSNCPPAEASLPVNKNLKPLRTALRLKEDDDAQSATSSGTPRGTPRELRSSASGFSFRLDERAEKRKEFFSKLEEKIQAKEVERTSLQAKSKENQDEEVKKLRKRMTFKATPMPTFYKEPPPKTELKKIPTTRAISPKLGRHKSSVTVKNNCSEVDGPCLSPRLNISPKLRKSKSSVTANNSSEGCGSGRSPRLHPEQSNSTRGLRAESDKHVVASKKPIEKPQSRLRSQEIAVTKTERKSAKSKPDQADGEQSQNQKACRVENEEGKNKNQSMRLSECTEKIDPESAMDTAQNNSTVLKSSTLETTPHEVTVEG